MVQSYQQYYQLILGAGPGTGKHRFAFGYVSDTDAGIQYICATMHATMAGGCVTAAAQGAQLQS